MKYYLLSNRRVLRIVVLLCILSNHVVASFVVQPQLSTVRDIATEVPSTLQPYDPQKPQQNMPSLLSKVANKLTSLVPFKLQPKDAVTRMGERERRLQRKELTRDMKDALRPFPWPIRAFGNAITNTVGRTVGRESQKAEVLLADAQRLIASDHDTRADLGEPVKTGRLLSQSSQTSTVNGKKSTRIQTSFEVIGSRKSGIATMLADKYSRGHIVALRVRVGGISYDIDV